MTSWLHNRLLDDFSIEATPAQWQALPLRVWMPPGSQVYVPALPSSSRSVVAATCESIRAGGFEAVPHLAARAMKNRAMLAEWLQQMSDAGARSLLLVAGDRARSAGPFPDTLAVLDSGLVERFGFRRIGVAGHPEGHSHAAFAELLDSLWVKAAWAHENNCSMWIVTQFAFAAEPVVEWLAHIRSYEIGLPVRIGVPGPADVRTLLRFAIQCGIGPSARMLTHRPGDVFRLLGQWSPEPLLEALGRELSEYDEAQTDGVHVFPFGGLERSIEFFRSLRHQANDMQPRAAIGS